LSRYSRVAWGIVLACTLLLLLTPALNAQLLERLPYSGSVLVSRAIRAGRIQIQPGSADQAVNPDLTCSPAPCVFTPVRASNNGSQVANEHALAVNPVNLKQFFSGANDFNCGSSLQGLYTTSDGGTTWTHHCMGNSSGAGDVVGDYDRNGIVYAGGINFGATGVVTVSTSSDNGTNWSTPKTAVPALLGYLADKPWMEIDKNVASPHVNNIYISATQFAFSSNSEISVTRSSDGGATWSTVAVDTQQVFPKVDQFSDLAIGPDGTVYVSWQRCTGNGPAGDCGGTNATMVLSKSTDGGATWSAPTTITTTKLTPDACFCAFYGSLPNTSERVSNIPAIAVTGSGATAKVYVIYYNWTGSQMQVLLITSLDGGATWGTPVRVTASNTGDQFFPWVNLSANGGRIGATWLDRRNDPSNRKYQPFFAMSSNTGASFGNSHAISSAMSDPLKDGFGGGFMGDYRINVFAGKAVYATWMDTTFTNNNCQDAFGGVQLQ
jgi:hypothetical protein